MSIRIPVWRFSIAILSMALISSCASYHLLPARNYSAADSTIPRVVRIVYDQDGNIYPPEPNPFGLQLPDMIDNNDRPFMLPVHYAGQIPSYDSETLTTVAIDTVRNALEASPSSRLVILIHGFNNDYVAASGQYEALRSEIGTADPGARHVYLQVYWDGLYKGDGTAPLPFSYFAKALTHSNLAGMCGLRRLVSALPQGTGVTFVTHSRGAAVALTAATDPSIATDPKFRQCKPPPRPVSSRRGDIALVAFAPAIGDGHMWKSGEPNLAHYAYFDRLYVGVNSNDPATNKKAAGIKLGCRRKGNTCLGADPGYVATLAARSDGRMQYVEFSQPYHALKTYLADQPKSRCLLWAGRLIASKPSDCRLTR